MADLNIGHSYQLLKLIMSDARKAHIVQAINYFTFRLQKLHQRQTICGINLFSGLLLAAAACDGASRDELLSAIGMKSQDWESIVGGFKTLTKGLQTSGTLSNANSIWYRAGVELDTTFVTSVKRDLDATTGEIDDEAIADHVRTATKGRINPDMNTPPLTALLLVSCSYFKTDWLMPFDACDTFKSQFQSFDGASLNCDMMSQETDLRYQETANFKAIILPYKHFGTTPKAPIWEAVFILPKNKAESDLQAVITTIATDWEGFIQDFAKGTSFVDINLPRFQVRTEVDVSSTLETMGVLAAFQPSLDFWAVVPRTEMSISRVLHMTFLKCDEQGTEVGAMTETEEEDAEADVDFHADRPFWMVIWDRASGVVLSSAVVASV